MGYGQRLSSDSGLVGASGLCMLIATWATSIMFNGHCGRLFPSGPKLTVSKLIQ